MKGLGLSFCSLHRERRKWKERILEGPSMDPCLGFSSIEHHWFESFTKIQNSFESDSNLMIRMIFP